MGNLAAMAATDATIFDVCTGSSRKGSDEDLTVSDGHPESLMHERSPVHTSSSTPKRGRTTRLPAFLRASFSGRTRRCRLSWHSPLTMIALTPLVLVVRASRRVFTDSFKSYESMVFTHSTPTPLRARLRSMSTTSPR